MGINFFGTDPVSAGFGLFNAGGIIFMIVGISFSKRLADKFGKRDVYKYGLIVATVFILIFYFFCVKTSLRRSYWCGLLFGSFQDIQV